MQEARNLNFSLWMNDKNVVCIYTYICIHTYTYTHRHAYMYLYMHMCVCAQFLSCVWLCNPMTTAHQALLSMGFPKQEYWSGLLLPSRGSFQPRDRNQFFCFGRQILYHWATWEAPIYVYIDIHTHIYMHIYIYRHIYLQWTITQP